MTDIENEVARPGVVVVFSGGLDSTTALYWARVYHDENPFLVSFNYGQRHVTELDHAMATAERLNLSRQHAIVDMQEYGDHVQDSSSALVDPDTEVPEGHYADETMKQTVVPNRNMVMLAMAAGIAIAEKRTGIVTGVHAGDHPVYPDCRPDFIIAVGNTIRIGNEGFCDPGFDVHAPFMHMQKYQIVQLGAELGVPFEETWSCYKGGDVHCGRCSTCVERLEAFSLAGVDDPTEYVDRDYWKTVVGQ